MGVSHSIAVPGPETPVQGVPVSREQRVPPALPPGSWLRRIAVKTRDRIVIVPTETLTRIDAEGNYVRLWAERSLLHKETLSGLCGRLDPTEFLRVHRSHAINLRAVIDLVPRQHGEFRIRLCDGAELTSGRLYKNEVRRAFGLS